MRKVSIYTVLAAVVFLCGCDLNDKQKFDMAAFEHERAAWEEQKMTAYQFTAESFPSYTRTIPITVKILPHEEPEMTYSYAYPNPFLDNPNSWNDTGDRLIASGNPFPPFDGIAIDELYESFAEIIAAYDDVKDAIIEIQYNNEYHYPERLNIVWALNQGAVGNGFSFRITAFEDLRD